VLGIWWPRLTATGGIAGVLTGLIASSGSILFALAGPPLSGWPAILVQQPAPWSVPLAFGVMALVSLRGRPPGWSTAAMLRLHLDEPRSTAPRDRSSTVRRLTRLLSR